MGTFIESMNLNISEKVKKIPKLNLIFRLITYHSFFPSTNITPKSKNISETSETQFKPMLTPTKNNLHLRDYPQSFHIIKLLPIKRGLD